MVGSEIDNAPGLAQADVGIAMGKSIDLVSSNSDIQIISPDLRSIITAIELNRSTLTKIEQNLLIAFIYNLCCIPIFSGIFYLLFSRSIAPVMAIGAMAGSSIFVLIDSLRSSRVKG
jgi:P-type E1-E2 ATPase